MIAVLLIAGSLLPTAAQPDSVATASISEAWVENVIRGEDVLPSLADAQRCAEESLGVPAVDDARGWAGRARWRGVVPSLDVSVGTDSDLDVRDSFSQQVARVTTAGQAFGFRIGARWELGEVIFHDAELRANREALARAAAVALVRERVTELYFERLEVLAAQRVRGELGLELKAARLDGLLRALTDGRLVWPASAVHEAGGDE
ncbi:MAG: hypothetical protein IT384_08200 [Deltaproteobacteria bacterium]|nr:hypothetical protein [Deltaproteobacteria bacterium]